MDGILTEKGIQGWLGGGKRFVKEFDRCFYDVSAAPTKIILFKNSSEGANMQAGGTGLAIAATRMDTTLKTEGEFATPNWIATHLGIMFDHQVVDTGTASTDNFPLPSDFKEMAARLWFTMFFDAGNEPHDQGGYLDFPIGKGWSGHLGVAEVTASVTAESNFLGNGNERKPMRRPYTCKPTTKPRLEIEALQGIALPSVDMSILAEVTGFSDG